MVTAQEDVPDSLLVKELSKDVVTFGIVEHDVLSIDFDGTGNRDG
jgi:hypothetical protein